MQGRQLLLTKVRLIRTSLQFDSFRAALNQEVPHQLIVNVTCKINKKSNMLLKLLSEINIAPPSLTPYLSCSGALMVEEKPPS